MDKYSSIPNVGLMQKVAWRYAKTTGIPFDDLFQEACIAYYKCLKRYNSDRSRVSTLAYVSMNNHLINYLKVEIKHTKNRYVEYEQNDNEENDIIINLEDNNFQYMDYLSQDANEIAKIVITTPKFFIDQPNEKICCRLKNLMEKKGWPRSRTNCAINDLKKVFSM